MSENDYQRRLGNRLRAIRQQQGLTLQQVEELSEGKWKAVVVGSYERGDRAVSVAKLAELGEFYNVPVSELLPKDDGSAGRGGPAGPPRVMLDLRRLASSELDPELQPVSRFAHTIQLQRGDFNGNVLTIRGEDLRALSVIYGTEPEDLIVRLEDEGVLSTA
ncbi:transcriptional regulator [Egibacter rhizosphaerae]|uniref:Transcriptional regulator n=1 Tax=Egibacter rhizosphaerae TaxID=1670831 RepID=A0A411YH95_9ACTN|nr:transcriptional regulator [Egibacter rhizosphaerae]QBI20587.1 transcriptional regulator [Egibacter rhizosphaerae]